MPRTALGFKGVYLVLVLQGDVYIVHTCDKPIFPKRIYFEIVPTTARIGHHLVG